MRRSQLCDAREWKVANSGQEVAARSIVVVRIDDVAKGQISQRRKIVIDLQGDVIPREMVGIRKKYLGPDSIGRRSTSASGVVSEYILDGRIKRQMEYILRRVGAAHINRH